MGFGVSQLLMGATNSTVRNNVFNNSDAQFGQRGYEYTSNNTSGAGVACSRTGTTAAGGQLLLPSIR